MFEHGVLPYLGRISDSILYTRVIRIFGMGESAVASMIKNVIDKQTNPTIAPYVKPGEVTLRVTAKCNNIDEGKALAEPVIKEICSIIGEAVYSTDDEGLNEVCSRMLADKQLTLAVAESCTGGMLSSALVSVPGQLTLVCRGGGYIFKRFQTKAAGGKARFSCPVWGCQPYSSRADGGGGTA